MNINETGDKLALINFAKDGIEYMRNSGISEEEIVNTLKEKFEFSDLMIDQLL